MALKKNGTEWTQEFVESLNGDDCIGCGRCFKACPSSVMTLETIEFEDEDGDEDERNVMVLVNDGECIGCLVCSKVCPKNCFTHKAA